MPEKYNYKRQMNIKNDLMPVIDAPAMATENKEKWFNRSLIQIEGSFARLGIAEGEYHWHKHDNDDEFFFCAGRETIRRPGRPQHRTGPMLGSYGKERDGAQDPRSAKNGDADG